MTGKPSAYQSEPTPEGEQGLIPGIRPISQRARIEELMAAPLGPRGPQKPLDLGLFFDRDGVPPRESQIDPLL